MQKKYMETLLAQIREKRARECVRQEVEGHIKEQKASYMADGMPETQAEEKAVTDMGDPVETGSALDLLHRPKPAWGTLAIIAVLCAAGVILQYAAYIEHPSSNIGRCFFEKQCRHAVLGFLILCGVYLIDYTRIAKYARYLCTGILLLLFLAGYCVTSFGLYRTGNGIHLGLFRYGIVINIDIVYILFYLYLPLYGAVLYSYRNCRIQELCRIFLYTVLPICFAYHFAHLAVFMNVTIILLLMLITAAAKGWFPAAVKRRHVSGRWQFTKLILTFLSGMILLFVLFYPKMTDYQKARIQAWLNPAAFSGGSGYICSIIRSILNESQLIGSTGRTVRMNLPNFETDYILTYIIGTFGILAAAALVILILMLGAKLLHISFCQKNQLGMIMGLGCSLAFIIQCTEYIFVNLSLLPASGLYFPLISYGGSGMLQTCILLGILLSIYRYENISSDSIQDFAFQRKIRKNV